MAGNGQGSNESKKRKRVSATHAVEDKSNPKKVKLPSNALNKGPKKPFKSSKQQPHNIKSQFAKSEAAAEKKAPKTKRELRLQAKELAEARKKKRKPYYTLEQVCNL